MLAHLALALLISKTPAVSPGITPFPSLQAVQNMAQAVSPKSSPPKPGPASIPPPVASHPGAVQSQPVVVQAKPAAPPPPTYPYTGNQGADLVTLGRYLVANGYSRAGAAGIASCIDGESQADPEAYQGSPSGGAGLIQWTPVTTTGSYGATFTGQPGFDWSNQLGAILRYNATNGDVGQLNSQPGPMAAADYYSQNFERPQITDSDVRASVAYDVYQALGG